MAEFKARFLGALKRIKILLKCQIAQKYKFATSTKKTIINLLFKVVIAVLIVLGMQKIMSYFNFVTNFEFDKHFLAFIILIFFIISIISSFSNITSQLFNGTDNEFLFAMPVKSEEVFISKLLLVIFNEIRSSFLVFLPIFIGFGLGVNSCYFGVNFPVTINYYIISVFMCLIIPFISIAIATLLAIPIRLYKNLIKNNTVLVILNFTVIFAVGFFLFNMLVTVIINAMNFLTQINVLAQKLSSFLYNFSRNTVVFKFISNAFAGNYLRVLLLIGIAIVLFVIAYLVIKPLYFKMVLGQSSHRKRVFRFKEQKVNSPRLTVFKKDFSMLFGNGGDFFKYFALIIILPFILILINRIFTINDISLKGTYLIVATNILIISMFTGMSCSYVASALTMEGSNFYIFQTTPVSSKWQLLSKFIINFSVNLMVIIACGIILAFNGKIPVGNIFLIISVCAFVNFGHLCYSLRKELAKPMIDWYDKSETNMHKNLSHCISRGLLLGVIIGAFAFKFYLIAPSRAWFELLLMGLVYAVYQVVTLLKRKNYLLKQINK